MFDETKKSVESILSQRLSSPFYGTLIISWLIWNWKIIYLTIFISEKNISGTKIDYILKNYNDACHIIWFPLISTFILLVLVPFLTYWAYWLELIFNKKRFDRKNIVESNQLLSLEQSINLREEIVNMEKKFDSLLAGKNLEIEQMKGIIANYSASAIMSETTGTQVGGSDLYKLVDQIKESTKLLAAFKVIDRYVLGGYTGLVNATGMTPEALSFYVSNDLIEPNSNKYLWTAKGKQVTKILNDDAQWL